MSVDPPGRLPSPPIRPGGLQDCSSVYALESSSNYVISSMMVRVMSCILFTRQAMMAIGKDRCTTFTNMS